VASRLTDDPDVTVAVIEAGFNAEGLREVSASLSTMLAVDSLGGDWADIRPRLEWERNNL
jgi:hypothetical protein